MKTQFTLCLWFGLSCAVRAQVTPDVAATAAPAARKQPVTDAYFGKKVTDNYRWLESLDSQEVKDWFKAQGAYTSRLLDAIPGRDSLVNTLVRYDALKSARITGIIRRNGRYFYKKTLPVENVGKLYYRQGKTGAEVLLFDPSADDKTKTHSIAYFMPSEDGRKLALGVTEGGAELATIRVVNVDTKQFYPEQIFPSWFGVSGWNPDHTGFFYAPDNSADVNDVNRSKNMKARYHVVGTDPKQDREIFSAAKYPQWGIRPNEIPVVGYSEDFNYLIAYLSNVDRRLNCYIAPATDLNKPVVNWKRLTTPEDSVINAVFVNNRMYMQSIRQARKGKILVTDARNPDVRAATEILAEGPQKIESISAGKDYVFITLSDGINMSARQYNTQETGGSRTRAGGKNAGRWEPVNLPATGTAFISSLEPAKTNDCLIYLTSWKQPSTIYEYDPLTKTVAVSAFHIAADYPGVDELVVEEIEVPSHDGTLVPLSLIYNRKVKKDGNAVCFMTGYGAYGISADPYFSTRSLALLNKGVIVAETHPRGGSEKGQDWYQAGYKTTKPNTWKDFIACGEYLIKNNYTTAGRLIGEGTSAGGILIGRAITERPDLFAAAISNVSCSNALRLENSPNGPTNTPEFGSIKDSVECMALYEMDAFQHVKEGTNYPAVMCIGGMNDPRVVAWQPGKLAAALQNATSSGKPVVLQVNYDNGHFTEDKKVTFRNFANMYAFALWQAGHPDFQPKTIGKK